MFLMEFFTLYADCTPVHRHCPLYRVVIVIVRVRVRVYACFVALPRFVKGVLFLVLASLDLYDIVTKGVNFSYLSTCSY